MKKFFGNLWLFFLILTCLPGFPAQAAERRREMSWSPVYSLETYPNLPDAAQPMLTSAALGELKDETYPRWIDRVNLPDYALSFYKALEDASDNDGVNDFLIKDEYYTPYPLTDVYRAPVGSVVYDENCAGILVKALYNVPKVRFDQEFQEVSEYIETVYAAFDRDHPQVFWKADSYQCGWISMTDEDDPEGDLFILFMLWNENGTYGSYSQRLSAMNEAAIRKQMADTEADIQKILQGAPQNGSRYDTLRYFNDYLTKHNQYNTAYTAGSDPRKFPWDIHKCTNALHGKFGADGPVCESYARAMKVLCDRRGIPCVLVDGIAKNSASDPGEGHMWNYMQMENGNWYMTDVTWNDPSTGSTPQAQSSSETDRWLLLGANAQVDGKGMTLSQSHPVENQVFTDGLRFLNGPPLHSASYVGLYFTGMPEEVEPGKQLTLQPVLTRQTGARYTYGATGLPRGLNLDSATGRITGAVTDALPGVVTATVTLYENRSPVEACTLTFRPVEFGAVWQDARTAKISAAAGGTYTVVFAAYDRKNILVQCETQQVTFAAAGSKTVSTSLTGNGAAYRKVMLWDSLTGLRPYAMDRWPQ